MSHANAALTPRARLRLARLVVDHGWSISRAAERYDVSWPTAKRWADRYRQAGEAGGVAVERVLSDNGSCYRSRIWRDTCTELGVTHKRTRPYRPQTNGKIERFHRTLADGWAFKKLYASESARRAALPAWIHNYNHHRPHTAIGGSAPISRLTNLSDQYS